MLTIPPQEDGLILSLHLWKPRKGLLQVTQLLTANEGFEYRPVSPAGWGRGGPAPQTEANQQALFLGAKQAAAGLRECARELGHSGLLSATPMGMHGQPWPGSCVNIFILPEEWLRNDS